MAIKYVNKPTPAPAPAAGAVASGKGVSYPLDAGKKFSLKGKAVAVESVDLGEFKILKDLTLTVEKGGTRKFLIHKTKPGVWYEIVFCDPLSDQPDLFKLRSPAGLVFDSKAGITTPQKYAVIAGPAGVSEPSKGVMDHVRFLAAQPEKK